MPDPSVQRFRRVIEVALRHLEARRPEINDLNVFPVADGDTGDNMVRTMDAVRQALDRLERDSGADAPREKIVRTVAEAALLGARGNSGVITSQIVRGAAEVLATPTGRLVDPALISEALRNAADAARAGVAEPVEGTILTVADEMANAAAQQLADRAKPLGEEITDAEQNALLAEMLAVVLNAGEEAVRRTPEQLQVLADADTVDAGALALVVLVRGMIAGLLGADEGLPPLPHYPPARLSGLEHADSKYQYCLNLIVRGEELSGEVPAGVTELGDSLEVVGEGPMVRVHIHTDDPSRVEDLFAALGEVHVDSCDDMHEQVRARAARATGTGVVVVSHGGGFRRVFEGEYAAVVVEGGPSLNPSTEEILAGIERAAASEVVVLPNSPNVVLAAEEAARASAKSVSVVPCHTPQAAIELLIEADTGLGAEELAAGMTAALESVRTAGVAEAAREDAEGRFAVGDAVGLVGNEVVAWGEPAATLEGTMAAILDGAEVLTVWTAEAAPLSADEVEALVPDDVEVQVLEGGQANHWWLLSAL